MHLLAPIKSRRFAPADVSLATQTQYRAQATTVLRAFAGCGLGNAQLPDLTRFQQLRVLDLAHNKLTNLQSLQLSKFPQLQALDVSFNSIADAPPAVGALLDAQSSLRCLILHHNPMMQNAQTRIHVLAAIPSLLSANYPLCVLDVPITLEDRLAAWSLTHPHANAATKAQAHSAAVFADAISDATRSRMTSLYAPSQMIVAPKSLADLSNLRQVVLRGNKLTDLDALHLQGLTRLQALDLRDNQIHFGSRSGFNALSHLLLALSNLVFLGISGNAAGCMSSAPTFEKLLSKLDVVMYV